MMAVGRAHAGGEAVGVLNLDSAPPQAAIEDLLKHDHIMTAQVIELPPAGSFPSWLQD